MPHKSSLISLAMQALMNQTIRKQRGRNERLALTSEAFLFAVAYQVPAWLLGFLLKFLIPHPGLRAAFVLPGTFVHELLHLIVGVILNGKPVSLSLWPRRANRGQWILGSVGFANLRWYNAMFIGLAPVLAIAVAMLFAPSPNGWSPGANDLKHWAVAAPILAMCTPSTTDLKLALKSWPIICGGMAIVAWRMFW